MLSVVDHSVESLTRRSLKRTMTSCAR
jgi:hypothetical protein